MILCGFFVLLANELLPQQESAPQKHHSEISLQHIYRNECKGHLTATNGFLWPTETALHKDDLVSIFKASDLSP